MNNSVTNIPRPSNEPLFDYWGSTENRTALQKAVAELTSAKLEIPLVIGGREVKTGRLAEVRCPHDHNRVLAVYHQAGPEETVQAAEAAQAAWADWAAMSTQARLAVFLKAAELLATKYRFRLAAATMVNQSKTAFQAEIDAIGELIDFLRFNAYYVEQLERIQPDSGDGDLNRLEYRPLEGFILAVTPFNFTSIAANLPSAPAMLGNTALWKPASSVVLSNYIVMEIFQEAGLPAGVINFLPGPGKEVGPTALARPDLAGIHFTGSTETFQYLWSQVGQRLSTYRSYPRLVGETGGKDFIVGHASADPAALAAGLIRGAFEYQGQKCSAASRAYLPAGMWPQLKDRLIEETGQIKMGDPTDPANFIGAVIDRPALDRIKGYLELAQTDPACEILVGGKVDDQVGYFVEPTIIQTTDPNHRLLNEEIFGPVLTVYVYPDDEFEQVLELCDRTSPYGLTGAIFAQDRTAVELASAKLRFAAGNFYVNDKPTGAVVGRQPFGGARASGTNDKAGSILNMVRWANARTIKENLNPPTDWRYPFMTD